MSEICFPIELLSLYIKDSGLQKNDFICMDELKDFKSVGFLFTLS